MIKNSTLLLGFVLSATAANAQLLTITDEGGATVNGQVVTLTAPASTVEMGIALMVHSNSSSNKQIGVKRYELGGLSGSANYFCWSECYGEQPYGAVPLWVAPDPVPMPAGSDYMGFHGYNKPYGSPGIFSFRYVWYDMSNPNDSVFVDLLFDAQTTGINEIASTAASLAVFPNPSTGGDISFTYELSAASRGRLIVRNALGEAVINRTLRNDRTSSIIGEGTLSQGIWFATLEKDGRAVATSRFVVTR